MTQRRARFRRYVMMAVGASGLLCLGALTRVVSPRADAAVDLRSASAVEWSAALEKTSGAAAQVGQMERVAAAAVEPARVPQEVPAPVAAEDPDPEEEQTADKNTPKKDVAPAPSAAPPAPVESAAASAVPVASAPVHAEAAAPNSSAAPPVAPAAGAPGRTASQERESARNALEKGSVVVAAIAATRAVQLDPTDAEAWLILGAAELQRGRPTDARNAFHSCVEKGKRGPVQECVQMLH